MLFCVVKIVLMCRTVLCCDVLSINILPDLPLITSYVLLLS